MNTIANNGRKVVILVLATLLLTLAVFVAVSATTSTMDDAHAGTRVGTSPGSREST